MQLKFLYALGFLLCLSTLASSNECTRHCAGNGTKVSAVSEVSESESAAQQPASSIIQLLYI